MPLLVVALALFLSACDYNAERVHDGSSFLSQPSMLAGTPRWSMPASLASARGRHTAILLQQGKVLVMGGGGPGGILASSELFDLGTGSWASTGALTQSRRDHTVTLLSSGKVLVVGGEGPSGTLASAELYDPATGSWTATGVLSQARKNHTVTLLPSGKVLVVGGEGLSGALDSAELYDEATGSWTSTGSLAQGRGFSTATLLPSGKVLVVGGEDASGTLASAELYDEATGSWSSSLSLSRARKSHTATLLPSGKVLVVGGEDASGALASAELYDEATGSWAATGSLARGRTGGTATLLPSGKVLVAGGADPSSPLTSAELYDEATGSWASTLSLSQARALHTATLLPSGKVLVVGGEGPSGALTGVELYDPAASSWAATGGSFSVQERSAATGTLLPSGKVLVAGGSDFDVSLASAQLYDPATGSWAATGSLTQSRSYQTATLLPSGKVLVAGGYDATLDYRASAEVYEPATGTWTATGSLTQGRFCHTATLLPSGKVLVVGGLSPNSYLASAELYDPATGSWATTGSLIQSRACHTATLLPSGKVLVAGGMQYGEPTSAELYDPATGSWTATGSLVQGRYSHTATLLPSGKVLIVGGEGLTAASRTSAEVYDPATGSWTAIGSLVQGRYSHTATLLPSGKVLIVGGSNPIDSLSSAEVYDPATGSWTTTSSLSRRRVHHTATLLPSGKVFVSAGYLAGGTSELYDDTGAHPSWGPDIASVSSSAPLIPGSAFTVNGSLFRGVSEASGGSSRSSSTDFPFLTLLDMERGRLVALPSQDFSSTHVNSSVPELPPGQYLLSLTVNGLTSSKVLEIAAAPDTVPPTVTLTSPGAGATLKGTVILSAAALDNIAVTRVEFYDGAMLLATDTAQPFNLSWDTRAVANGAHLLTVKAYDAAEQSATSPGVSVTVDNDLSPPTVAFSAPAAGATVVGSVTLTATATDNVRVIRVEFYEGGTLLGTDTSSPYGLSWNTRTGANGDRTLTAKAYDAAGNTGVATVTVTASNDFVSPTVTLTSPGEGATLSGTVLLSAAASDDRAVSRVAFFIGGQQVSIDSTAPYTFSYNTRSQSNGAKVITAKAYDAANNVGTSAPVNVIFDNDFTPPTVTLTSPGEGATLSGTVVFTATASDDRAVSRVVFLVGSTQVGSDSTAPYTFSYNTRNLGNGAKIITAKAYDAVSNVGTSAPVNVIFDNDFTPPTTSIGDVTVKSR